MKAMEITVDRFGRIVLPKQLRDDLGLEPGSVVRAEERGKTIVLVPAGNDSPLREEGGVLVFAASPAGDVVGAVRQERSRRDRKSTCSWKR